MNHITIATSIAPGANLANQQLAVASWQQLGFAVISVNAPEEIAVLAPHFPTIRFAAVSRDGREKFGKPYIYFDDLLACLYEEGAPICGIVNSDIHLLDNRLYDFVLTEASGAFLFGARIDVDSLERRYQGDWFQGFDFFFFDRSLIPRYPREDFCIGLPWWDYWIVLIPLACDYPVKKLISPVAYHVRHTPGNLSSNSWIPLGMTLAKYFPAPFEVNESTIPRYNPLAFAALDHMAASVSLPTHHVPISVIVHTLNEESNIRNCLECLKWADELIVVDMYSDDRTVAIAREYTDRILMHERCGYVEPARQWAIEQAAYEWILVVDADELVPLALRDLLREIADTDSYDVVVIPRANYVFGHLMKGSGRAANQDKQARFFKKSFVTMNPRIHQSPLAASGNIRIGHLAGEEQAFIHFNNTDVAHALEKLERYTTIEAESDYVAGKSLSLERAWEQSIGTLQDIVLHKEGLKKDGVFGLAIGMIMAFYHFTAALKLKLIEEYGTTTREGILRKYQQIADQIIEEYRETEK